MLKALAQMPSPLNQDIDAHEPGPANTRGMMPEPSQLSHSLSAAPHPSPSQAVYVDRHMLILTTSWRMWWCIRCLGRAIFRYINDSAAVHVDNEHPGDCPTVLDAWAKQCWGVQLYKWFAVASWLLCGSAYPQILRNSKKMWLNTHLYTFLEICWCYYQWCVRCLICNISLCDFQMKEIRFYCILSYIFLESIC